MSITRINNNVAAVTATRNLNVTGRALEKNIERLSSGLRINRAGDDAAGITIRERLRGQIRGIDRAVLNAQDGISLSNTSEAALDQIVNNLHRLRELAIQAGNTGTNDFQAIQAIQDEVFQQVDEVNRIAETSQFGTRVLFNGDNSNTTNVKKGQDDIGVRISDDPNASNLRSGTSVLNIVRTNAGRETLLPSEVIGSQQVFATGIKDSTDIVVSVDAFASTLPLQSVASLAAGTALTAASTLGSHYFAGISLAATDIISFEGVLSDGITAFSGSILISSGGAAPTTVQDIMSTIQQSISAAEAALFGGVTIPTDFIQTEVTLDDGRLKFVSNKVDATLGLIDAAAPSGFDINFAVIDSGTTVAGRVASTRDLVRGEYVGGKIGNTVNSITGSTFDSGEFAITVTDIIPPVRQKVESNLQFRDTTGAILDRSASLGQLGLNGTFVNGIYTQYVTLGNPVDLAGPPTAASLAAATKFVIEGTNPDGTTFSTSITYANGDDAVAGVRDGYANSISGIIEELNNRNRSSAVNGAGNQSGFTDAVLTLTGNGTFELIDDVAEESKTTFLIRVETPFNTDQQTINDRAVLKRSGTEETATVSVAGGELQRVTVGDFVVLEAPEPTVFGETQQRVALRLGGGDRFQGGTERTIFNEGEDTLEVEAQEYVGTLNSGIPVTFQNGDQDVFFISGVSEGVAETIMLDFDIVLDVTGPPTDGSPNTGIAVLLSTLNSALNFQVGAFAGQDLQVNMPDLRGDNLGFGRGSGMTVSDINVTTVSGVNAALEIIDEALDQVSRARSTLGAFVNRLEATISNLSVASENLTASESRLSDADIAAETTSFTLHQVLYQAGTSVLAQANFLPQGLLSLLG